MRKSAKTLSVILSLIMIITAIPFTASAETYSGICGKNLTWEFDDYTRILTISGTGAMYDFDFDNRPWEKYQYVINMVVIRDGVTTIGDKAFYGCERLTNITIGDDLITIGDFAFWDCTSLTSVTIPDSVTTIGNSVFYNCGSLTSIMVDSNNQYYSSDEYGVLFNKDKTTLIKYPIGNKRISYIIPNSVTSIDAFAFSSCTSLTGVTIPDSVTKIGEHAFSGCRGLTSVTIPDGVTKIDSHTFYHCSSLTSVTLPESLTSIGDGAFDGCRRLVSVEIPNNVTAIGTWSFEYCTSLTNVTIPDSVTKIGGYAFGNCESLTNVTIPDSVTKIGGYAFDDCISLTDVYYSGTKEEWYAISIGSYNYPLLNAKIHFNYNPHTHEYDEWTVVTEPTCTEAGLKTRTCECDDMEREEIPATGHNYETVATAPTCTERGYSTYTCSVCNDTYVDNYVDAIGHNYETVATAPTCTERGYTTYTCSLCGDSYIENYVEATDHIYNSVVTPATCTDSGYTTCTCECGDTYIANITPATGHNDSDNNGYCETCDKLTCSHSCHKTGFEGFFWKIANFFNKLFGSNKYCDCGATHY